MYCHSPLIVSVLVETAGSKGFEKEKRKQLITTPSLIGNTAIVRSDDKLPAAVLISVTATPLSWLRELAGVRPATLHLRTSPVPSQVKLTLSSFIRTVTDWGGDVITTR